MTGHKAQRYSLFGLLYFSQGAIMSYFTALNALYLRSFDVSMSQIGLIGALALIPFVLKIFLGMLSDRVNLLGLGHRKPYIIIGLLIQASCLMIVPSVHPGTQFSLFAGLAFLVMTGMALYDTCTDGLALDTTPPSELGTIQGIMVGGRALGVVVISALVGFMVQHLSWAAAFWALAALSLLPLPLVLGVQEAPRPEGQRFEWQAFRAFGRRSVLALGTLGALYSLIINAASEIVNPFIQVEFNLSLSTIGLLTTVWGLGTVVGGLTGGWITDHFGQRRALTVALIVSLVAILSLALIFQPQVAWPLVFLFGMAYGYYETVYFAISMQLSDRRIAASMFSILMAIANIGTGVGLALSGTLVDAVGFRWTLTIIALLNLLALPLLAALFQPQSYRQEVLTDSL